VVKLLWLAICDIEDKRARAREAERGKPANQRTAPARLIEGAITTGWRQALAADRGPPCGSSPCLDSYPSSWCSVGE